MSTAGGPTDADLNWSEGLARHYELHELDAMNVWLDVNLALNQQRLESVTNRLCTVIALGAALITLLATSTTQDALPLAVIAGVVVLVSIGAAGTGLATVIKPDRDPTTTWSTMWGERQVGELQVVLYRRRSNLFDQQRAVIDSRANALKFSSWALAAASLLCVFAIVVSRLVGGTSG